MLPCLFAGRSPFGAGRGGGGRGTSPCRPLGFSSRSGIVSADAPAQRTTANNNENRRKNPVNKPGSDPSASVPSGRWPCCSRFAVGPWIHRPAVDARRRFREVGSHLSVLCHCVTSSLQFNRGKNRGCTFTVLCNRPSTASFVVKELVNCTEFLLHVVVVIFTWFNEFVPPFGGVGLKCTAALSSSVDSISLRIFFRTILVFFFKHNSRLSFRSSQFLERHHLFQLNGTHSALFFQGKFEVSFAGKELLTSLW